MCTYIHVLYEGVQEYFGNDAVTPAVGMCLCDASFELGLGYDETRRTRWSRWVQMAIPSFICATLQTSAPIPHVRAGFPG